MGPSVCPHLRASPAAGPRGLRGQALRAPLDVAAGDAVRHTVAADDMGLEGRRCLIKQIQRITARALRSSHRSAESRVTSFLFPKLSRSH